MKILIEFEKLNVFATKIMINLQAQSSEETGVNFPQPQPSEESESINVESDNTFPRENISDGKTDLIK